jgi:hypothetical protein
VYLYLARLPFQVSHSQASHSQALAFLVVASQVWQFLHLLSPASVYLAAVCRVWLFPHLCFPV